MNSNFINTVTLCGRVGRIATRGSLTHFALLLEEVHYNPDGYAVVDCTWVSVMYNGAETLLKGDWVHIEGRLKTNRYFDTDGVERSSLEVFATSIRKVVK